MATLLQAGLAGLSFEEGEFGVCGYVVKVRTCVIRRPPLLLLASASGTPPGPTWSCHWKDTVPHVSSTLVLVHPSADRHDFRLLARHRAWMLWGSWRTATASCRPGWCLGWTS